MTDLVPVNEYAIVKQDENFGEIIEANMGDEGLTSFDLTRIKIPTGGGKVWEIPSIEGESDSQSAVTGVVIAHRAPRAFWQTRFEDSGGGTPPDCSSQDGKIGDGVFGPGSEGNPTGQCSKCPMSQWKSDPRGGDGQACKQMKLLFTLMPDNLLPVAMFLPPTSIKPMKQYFLGLTTKGIKFSDVVTKLELEQTKGGPGGNITYSVVKPSMAARLDGEDLAKIRSYTDQIASALATVTITQEDLETVRDDS